MIMIKRSLLAQLELHLASREISLIVGPRQAGKTTLMLILKKALEEQGLPTVYLNLDIEADMRHFYSQEALVRKIELEVGKMKAFVFIDEIQRKENAGLFLKGLYDMGLPHKFIVSGSGSVELKEKIHESLVGRKRVFELNTLSFDEFANFKTEDRYSDRISAYLRSEPERARHLLEEYMNFGGYPRVALAENAGAKQGEIAEIYQSYLEKDIVYLLQVRKSDALSRLVRILAAQSGRLVNITGLSSELGISRLNNQRLSLVLGKNVHREESHPFLSQHPEGNPQIAARLFLRPGLEKLRSGRFRPAERERGRICFSKLRFQLDERNNEIRRS
jgi:predicted AAA+ superfamily ATPase